MTVFVAVRVVVSAVAGSAVMMGLSLSRYKPFAWPTSPSLFSLLRSVKSRPSIIG